MCKKLFFCYLSSNLENENKWHIFANNTKIVFHMFWNVFGREQLTESLLPIMFQIFFQISQSVHQLHNITNYTYIEKQCSILNKLDIHCLFTLLWTNWKLYLATRFLILINHFYLCFYDNYVKSTFASRSWIWKTVIYSYRNILWIFVFKKSRLSYIMFI